jgi:hypothetical protein
MEMGCKAVSCIGVAQGVIPAFSILAVLEMVVHSLIISFSLI